MKTPMRFGTTGTLALVAAISMAQGIQVTIDGVPVSFQGQGAVMRGGRVLVPLRGIMEQMGATVRWNPDTQTVTARSNGSNVRLGIGERTASVNGQPMDLDVPAQIIGGSTMVPLRFVGEALGNTVQWDAQVQAVEITTGGGSAYNFAQNQQNNRPERFNRGDTNAPMFFPAGSVLPVSLDDPLSSQDNSHGDRFTTTVAANGASLPAGTKIEGYVEGAKPRSGDKPGMLELRFDRLDMPNGDTIPIHGSLIGLDDKSVTHRGGRLVATSTSVDRAAFTGYGAGAGLIVGLIGHRPLEDTALGALLGYGIGVFQRPQVHNVTLSPGTQFGVRLNSDVSIKGG